MSADEDTVKTGSPQASPVSSLQLSECTIGGYGAAAATPDFDSAACPITNDNGTGWRSGRRGSEPNQRKNTFHLSKQQPQQQQQMTATSSSRLMKRRNTANSAFKHPHAWGKRRRRANSESDSLLPTNFYLGGNINDPLNLNSLLDEEVSRALNAETPKSSPLPARSREPVEILIPRDITDPLNLNGGAAEDGSVLVAPTRGGGGGGRRRHRNRHHGGGGGAGGAGGGGGGGAMAAHVTLLEAGGSEGVSTVQPLPPHNLSKDSDGPSRPCGDSGERCSVEEAAAAAAAAVVALPVSAKESTPSSASWPPGGSAQHGSRRKRRRNSGKTEQPATQTAGRWSGAGDKARRAGPGSRQYPQQQQQKKKFQFGNYNKYYGYRNPSNSEDPRVRLLRPEWFEGKDVLDLGCNSGHLTLYVAKRLRPARILGLDIDGGLIHAARKNIRHYLSEVQTQEARSATQCAKQEERNGNKEEEHHLDKDRHHDDSGHQSETATQQQDGQPVDMEQEDCRPPSAGHSVSCSLFPVSLRISRGPIAAPLLAETPVTKPGEFPSNVSFIKANYVLDSDHLVLTQRPEYDVIMCLSVTKWVHLNWGDSGLVRLFKRVFKHLRPGGLFLLEPQPWESYVRRKKLTDNICKNYHSIRLKPDQFPSYLTTEVGFTSFEYLGAPKCSTRGFQRPVYLFYK